MPRPKNAIIGIYKITSPSNRIYIGQSINIIGRKQEYKSTKAKGQPKLYRSIIKYGWENHTHEIIEECSIEQLDERETFWKIYYLEQVDNDWNKMLFCDLYDAGGGPKSEETKRKISLGTTGIPKNHGHKISKATLGIKHPDGTGEKISRSKRGHINSNSHNQNISDGIKNTKKYTSERNTNISNSKKGIPNPKLSISKKGSIHPMKSKKIMQLDMNMNLIKIWNNTKEASHYLNIPKGQIVNNAAGFQKSTKGFKWVWFQEPEIEKVLLKDNKPVIWPVIQKDMDGNFIKEWSSIREITDNFPYHRGNIRNCCIGNRSSNYGYKWEYKE